ncbi:MAG: metallophosphoesterase [Deltaproteobacteria bacterium]|nr:metallophosphoesterase [Deltaproteobacteria bacterium]
MAELEIIGRILLGAAISGFIHGYVWVRLVRRSHLPRPWHLAVTSSMVLLWISIPITTWSRNVWPGLAATFGWVSMPWMALVGLTFVALVVLDVCTLTVRLGRRAITRRPVEVSVGRRTFLARVTGGTALAVGGTGMARGMFEARGTHEIVDVEITLDKLPAALDGFTIVQLSDLHVGMTIDRAFVQRVVDHTNRLAPDLIALTGDLVDGQVEDLREDIAPLASLRAKHGVFAVTGNHEYYSGADAWIEELKRLGARYLRNERVTIGNGDASFELAGVDDHGAHGWQGHGQDLPAATAGRDRERALVLLAHQPRQVRVAALHGVDLQLSGHTHGGQIWPWHYLVKIQQGGLLAGRYLHASTQLYVTRGCGYWGPPVRLLAPLEITRVILRSARV